MVKGWRSRLGREYTSAEAQPLITLLRRTRPFRAAAPAANARCWALVVATLWSVLILTIGCGAPVIQSEGAPAGHGVSGPLLSTPSPDMVRAGREYFLWASCGECHTIQGTRAQGRVGPDMTNFGSRPRVNILPNTPANVERWLRDPQAVNPKAHMPNQDLPPDIISKLTTFLETLR